MRARTRLNGLEVVTASVLSLVTVASGLCQCAPTTQGTLWGGNNSLLINLSRPVRTIRGTAVAFGDYKPLAGVLVEVYDHPEILQQNFSRDRAGQRRLVGCLTDDTGAFSFHLPPGDYELRLSKSYEWDVTSVCIRVSKSLFSSRKRLVIWVKLAS
jgi:hypothetical protein